MTDICLFDRDHLVSERPCQLAITCLKWTIETLEQGVKYVQI